MIRWWVRTQRSLLRMVFDVTRIGLAVECSVDRRLCLWLMMWLTERFAMDHTCLMGGFPEPTHFSRVCRRVCALAAQILLRFFEVKKYHVSFQSIYFLSFAASGTNFSTFRWLGCNGETLVGLPSFELTFFSPSVTVLRWWWGRWWGFFFLLLVMVEWQRLQFT